MDPHSRSFNPNKHLKEQFVSNLEGSSIIEIAALATIIPALFVSRHWMSFGILSDSLHATKAPSKKNNDAINGCRDWTVYVTALTLDFLVIVLPMLLFVTVLADWAQRCALCLILLFLALVAIKRIDSSSSYGEKGPQDVYSVRTSISAYRVFVMVITCLCILAVDFEIFPRRYAKTETYGTSLMDIGVGSFVLANALVSRQARNVSSMKCKTMLQSTSPLIILGFGRLVFTSGVDYQVHVGEYGVHWNFFFTLAAVAILTSAVNIHPQYCGILGVMILLGYQIWLASGLNAYLLSTERTGSLISQNKEGIFSIFGYWGMYLVGVLLGNYIFYENGPIPKMRNNRWTRSRIWILCAVFWLLTVILDKYVERVSRRTCNLAYVTFILALNFQALAILMISDIFPGNKTLVLEKAFNQNLLAMFLLANVLTGLINLSVDTISASSVTALLILVGYAFVLCVFAGFIEFLGIRLKFW